MTTTLGAIWTVLGRVRAYRLLLACIKSVLLGWRGPTFTSVPGQPGLCRRLLV